MCGINGLVDPGNRNLIELLDHMRDTMSHRGPDDADGKVWADHGVGLAQRRLSIIDLSSAGRNPMANEDETVWITFNGEIYNYQSIRRELEQYGHIFRSNTDTEVIIHAYEQWGDDHVQKLRGMFAYAIYDRRLRTSESPFRLLLVRDRLGIKPLHYYHDDELLLFASEIKALTAYPGIDLSIDRTALFDYLTYAYIPTPKTGYSRIRKLPAGHLLVFDGQKVQVRAYWDVPLDTGMITNSRSEAIEIVRDTLSEAVQLHLVSDVPVGCLLSGGLDSSTVVALMSKWVERPHTFTIDFDVAEHNEGDYARLIAQKFETSHHERIVSQDAVQDILPQMVSLYDEPFADGSAMPTLRVSQLAQQFVKVALSGDGGDEVFAGYRWYDLWMKRQAMRQRIPGFVQQYVFRPIGQNWPTKRKLSWKYWLEDMAADPLVQYAHLRELFSPTDKRLLTKDASEFDGYDDYWHWRQHWRPDLDAITRVQYVDLKTYLPDDILTKVDRASMAASLELRPPLLDHVLVETVFRIPSSIRFYNQEKKYLLKQAMTALLPEATLTRGKKGFSSPLNRWIAEQTPWLQSYYRQSPTYMNTDAMNHISRGSWGGKHWAILVLETWFRQEQVKLGVAG